MNSKVDSASNTTSTALDLENEIRKVFVGKKDCIDLLLVGFFTGLHVLIEDIPGVGKTTLAKSLAVSAGLDFGRIQFTPDLLPGDITGMTVWNQEKREFVFKEGAVMHQFILADEINRASARTQAALLEAMQERAVTVDGRTYPLPDPFFVIATQNPVHFAGTFLLPEAQIDRFGLSFSIGYPELDDEVLILDRFKEENPFASLKPVTGPDRIVEIRESVRKIYADPKIKTFLVAIAEKTRTSSYIRLGMSPRATQHLLLASQGRAMIQGREFVIPEDVVAMAKVVLRHRLVISPEARMESKTTDQVIDGILSRVPLPSGF